jgi:hypothetical protein
MIYILRRVRRYQRDNQNPYRKEKEDEGCLKFCNILKWSATV